MQRNHPSLRIRKRPSQPRNRTSQKSKRWNHKTGKILVNETWYDAEVNNWAVIRKCRPTKTQRMAPNS